ncbi:MAG: hypothetical protein ACXWZT_05200 [Gaiellaceae bacterium]
MTHRQGQHTLVAVVLGASAAIAVGPPAAAMPERAAHVSAVRAVSGSLVYVRGGNVWRARADGSGRRRLTRNGTVRDPYSPPSQADNGTILAVRGPWLYRLARSGRRLRRPVQVAAGLHNEGPLHELPFSPAVSPDGRKVALTKTLLQGVYDPRTGTRGLNLLSVTVEYRNAVSGVKLAERHVPGDYMQSPSWIDNRRLLVFAPYNSFAPQVFVDTPGGNLQPWFDDRLDGDSSFDRKLLDEGELTRAGDKLVLIRGTNVEADWRDASIAIYAVRGFSAPPTAVCSIRPLRGGPLGRPTWSPDGRSLAWSDGGGIWSTSVDLGTAGCGLTPKLIVPGGHSPDWGPAR